MTSSNGNFFRVTGPFCGKFTGQQWIPLTKASEAEVWCFMWSASEQAVEETIVRLVRRHRVHYDVTLMQSTYTSTAEHYQWRGQRHTFDAVPGHCTLQAGLRLHCVWHIIEYQFTTTGQHSQRPMKLLWRNVGWSYPCITIWKLVPALTTQHMPCMNSYIQQLVQIKWDVSVHGSNLYPLKPTLGPPKKFQYLTRAEEVVITRLRIAHTKATKSHILSRGPPTTCHRCGQTLTIDHMLLECAALQEIWDEYYTADSLKTLFEDSRDLHSWIFTRSWILLSDMNCQGL